MDAAPSWTKSFADGFHAIATAYSDYTKKSFEDTRSFVEKLSGVKSVDKAIELPNRIRKVGFRLVRGRVKDRRVVSRSGRAILQAVPWFPCQGDPDKSISLSLAMSAQDRPAHRGAFCRAPEPGTLAADPTWDPSQYRMDRCHRQCHDRRRTSSYASFTVADGDGKGVGSADRSAYRSRE
jgi:phasin protein